MYIKRNKVSSDNNNNFSSIAKISVFIGKVIAKIEMKLFRQILCHRSTFHVAGFSKEYLLCYFSQFLVLFY